MNAKTMKTIMERIFLECQALREAGQKEYAHDESSIFRNFKQTGQDIQLEKEKVLWIFLKKHLDGILSWINGHKSQREDVSGRINDAIVYLCILKAMADENKANQMSLSDLVEAAPLECRHKSVSFTQSGTMCSDCHRLLPEKSPAVKKAKETYRGIKGV